VSPAAFVTGGSGFIGGALIKRLVAEGWEVRGLARSGGSATVVSELGAEPVGGDLSDVAAMAEGAHGADVAFHAAARLGEWGSRQDFVRDNVTGTENTLRACAEAGVKRFVHVGTEAALLAGRPLVNVDETAPLMPDSAVPYAATKAMSEQAVRRANRDGFETLAVRPRLVWGVGDTTILPTLVESIESGRFAWIGKGRHLTSTTHVDNAVEGLVLAAEHGRPGEAYFVSDGEASVFREFVGELLATQGVEAPGFSIPRPLAHGLSTTLEAVWKALRIKRPPPLTRLAYWLLSQECTLDISKARRELGYEPAKTVEQGMAELRAAQVSSVPS
jgi:nucleoside-diphosphate-sugar epimerase